MKTILFVCAMLTLSSVVIAGQPPHSAPEKPRKAIIIYYSLTNNTRTMAEFIRKHYGFDIEEIELAQPYTAYYEELVDQTRDELRRGYLPPMKPLKADLDSYDMVLVGSPLWIYTLSLPAMSFLTEDDLFGKIVVPFCTRGLGTTEDGGVAFNGIAVPTSILRQ